jgi:peroxiredoxin
MKSFLREMGIFLVLGVVTAGGVYLVRQNRSLTEQNELLARRAVEPRPGLFVPALEVATLDGTSVVLGEIGRSQLLFFFNTTCQFCRASVPAWNEIAERLKETADIAVYGVALDSVARAQAYAEEQGLTFPVIAKPDPRLGGLYRVSGVPLVLITTDDGRMAYVRLGVLESPTAIDSVVAAARASSARAVAEEGA